MLLIQFGQVVESDPAFSVLNTVKFLVDFLLRMTSTFDNFPKSKKLCFFDGSILVYVDLVEKLCGGNFGKTGLPMLQGLSLIDYITAVDVENCENFINFSFENRSKFL